MMQRPRVSIIIPTHNGMNNIRRSVSSAFAQNYNNLEIIVVDDNGEGTEEQLKTQKIIEKFLHDTRFKYIVHKINRNGSAARNTGAKHSTGAYLNFLDDDDELGPDKISYQIQQMENISEEWAGSYSSTIIRSEGKIIRTVKATKSGNLLIEHLNSAVRIGTPSLLLRKSVWESVGGYDETFSRHQDWEFNARILDKYKLMAAEDVYYIRNYTFRHSARDIKIEERNLVHYTDLMLKTLKSISRHKLEDILRKKYITVLFGYLKKGRIRDFIRVWDEQHFGARDVYYILRYVFHYLKSRIVFGKAF